MQPHYHFNGDQVLFAGLSAIVVINLFRWLFAWLAQRSGVLGSIGTGLGGMVHFA